MKTSERHSLMLQGWTTWNSSKRQTGFMSLSPYCLWSFGSWLGERGKREEQLLHDSTLSACWSYRLSVLPDTQMVSKRGVPVLPCRTGAGQSVGQLGAATGSVLVDQVMPIPAWWGVISAGNVCFCIVQCQLIIRGLSTGGLTHKILPSYVFRAVYPDF